MCRAISRRAFGLIFLAATVLLSFADGRAEEGMWLPVLRGQFQTLTERAVLMHKHAAEDGLKAVVAADPDAAKATGDPWEEIAAAIDRQANPLSPPALRA